MTDSTQREVKQISLTRTFAWAGTLVAVDAFLVNQGVLSALVGLWMLLALLPRAVFTKESEQRRRHLFRSSLAGLRVELDQ